jgi:hypothetical protein
MDGEERLANAAARANGLRWEGSEGGIYHADDPYGSTAPFIDDATGGFLDPQLAEHIAAHDPGAILRRVESDRRIVAAVALCLNPHPGKPCTNVDEPYDSCDLHVEVADETVSPLAARLLALRYVDAPDFPEVLRMDEDTQP